MGYFFMDQLGWSSPEPEVTVPRARHIEGERERISSTLPGIEFKDVALVNRAIEEIRQQNTDIEAVEKELGRRLIESVERNNRGAFFSGIPIVGCTLVHSGEVWLGQMPPFIIKVVL